MVAINLVTGEVIDYDFDTPNGIQLNTPSMTYAFSSSDYEYKYKYMLQMNNSMMGNKITILKTDRENRQVMKDYYLSVGVYFHQKNDDRRIFIKVGASGVCYLMSEK